MNVDKVAKIIGDYLICVLSLALFTFVFSIPLEWWSFLIYSILLFVLVKLSVWASER